MRRLFGRLFQGARVALVMTCTGCTVMYVLLNGVMPLTPISKMAAASSPFAARDPYFVLSHWLVWPLMAFKEEFNRSLPNIAVPLGSMAIVLGMVVAFGVYLFDSAKLHMSRAYCLAARHKAAHRIAGFPLDSELTREITLRLIDQPATVGGKFYKQAVTLCERMHKVQRDFVLGPVITAPTRKVSEHCKQQKEARIHLLGVARQAKVLENELDALYREIERTLPAGEAPRA